MSSATVITGDLFESDAKYIVHQCNCVTWNAAHLAQSMFRRFPHADIYNPRRGTEKHDEPGTIIVRGDGESERFVVAILGQYYPGSPKYPNSSKDGYNVRQKYFRQGLSKLAEVTDLHSVAFPWGIGCGAAGGDWPTYLQMIQEFAASVPEVRVTIVQLPS